MCLLPRRGSTNILSGCFGYRLVKVLVGIDIQKSESCTWRVSVTWHCPIANRSEMEFVQRLDLRLELEVGCEVEFDFQRIVLVFGIRQDLDMRGDVGSSQHANSKLPYEGSCDLAFVDFWLRDFDTR